MFIFIWSFSLCSTPNLLGILLPHDPSPPFPQFPHPLSSPLIPSPLCNSLILRIHHSSSASSTLEVRSRFRSAVSLSVPFVGVDDGAGVIEGAVLVVRLAPSGEEDFWDFLFFFFFFSYLLFFVVGISHGEFQKCSEKNTNKTST